jgi:hypothetical protein
VIEIKHRWSGEVLFRCEKSTTAAALAAASAAGVDLRGADLRGVDLRGVDLRGAKLSDANLRGVDLRGVDLRGANLRGANLRGADLRGAKLSDANLSYTNLRGADFRDADFYSAHMQCNSGLIAVSVTWPGHGECGRQLLAIKQEGDAVYFCGCFSGSRDELLEYIKNGEEKHRPSRSLTLDVVDMLLAASLKEKGGAQ